MIVNLTNSPVNLMPHLAPQFRIICDENINQLKPSSGKQKFIIKH